MKNIVLMSVTALSFVVLSCNKKEYTIKDPIEVNETVDGTDYVDYKVIVTQNPMLKSSGIAWAEVTLTLNDQIITKQTDSNGIVQFNGIKAGSIPVRIEAENYISVMYTVNLKESSLMQENTQNNTNTVTSVKMFPKTVGAVAAQLKGRVKADLDLTNDTTGSGGFAIYKPGEEPEPVADSTKVIAFIDYRPEEVYENIIEINYEVQRMEDYTEDGYFIFKLPEGTYDVYLRAVDFEAEQSVYYPEPTSGDALDKSILYDIKTESMFFRADPVSLSGIKLVEGSAVVNDIEYEYYEF